MVDLKLNYSQIIDLYTSLMRMGEVSDLKAALAVAKTMNSISQDANIFIKQRERIIKKYGEVEGDQFKILPENLDKYMAEITELGNTESDAEIYQADVPLEAFQAEGVRAKDLLVASQYLIKKGSNDE